ncbi:hypothetical protein [Methylobacterium currus]|uniref:hypothetical protein n=1 Tax=Methylobacterium currus TaxID=2051553 RepID=UPI0013E0BA47|nr:hypothetical protein [Methylobacterium currus]
MYLLVESAILCTNHRTQRLALSGSIKICATRMMNYAARELARPARSADQYVEATATAATDA